MEWQAELRLVLHIIVAFILGGVIGWERELRGRSAGIRTFGAIAMGSCVFGIISIHATGALDPTRIASQVVVGVGFLGAGLIFRHGDAVAGLTTAATLWSTAAVGLSIAYGMYLVGILTTLITFILLILTKLPGWQRLSHKHYPEDRDSR